MESGAPSTLRTRTLGHWLVGSVLVFTGLFGMVVAAGAEPEATVTTPSSPALLRLADQARIAFRARVEPPPVTIVMFDIATREDTHAQRRYLLRAYDEALDALVAEGSRRGQAKVVERALRALVHGHSTDADRLLIAIAEREAARGAAGARAAAAAQRHAVALGELPTALNVFVGGGLGRTLHALGELALPAYRTVTELEPDDPWNWIVRGWLSQSPDDAMAFARAVSLPTAQGDPAARIEALKQIARIERAHGRVAEAEQSLKQALQLAMDQARASKTPRDARELSIVFDAMGDHHVAIKRPAAARRFYEAALKIRESRAHREPSNVEGQLDLISSHDRLAHVPRDPSSPEPHVSHLVEALRIYGALSERDRFRPMISPSSWPVMALLATSIGAVLTLVIGIVLLALYRRRVGRLMMESATASVVSAIDAQPASANPPREGHVRWLVTRAPWSAGANLSEASSRMLAAMRRRTWVEIAGAFAFALVAVLLYSGLRDVDFEPLRFLVLLTTWIWPVVFVLTLLWSGDRKRIALVFGTYFGILLLETLVSAVKAPAPLELMGHTLPGELLIPALWLQLVLPTALLFLFLNRRIRAVGPVLLPFLLIIVAGGIAATVLGSSYAGRTMFIKLFQALDLPFSTFTAAQHLVGMLIAAPLGWLVLLGLRRLYRARLISDQSVMFDSIWLFQSIQFVLLEIQYAEYGWLVIALFLVYKGVVVIASRIAALRDKAPPPSRVLLLRVFGFQRRTERFFDVMAARWRHAGPIQMISAPDLAAKTIDPDELMDFLSGRLRHRFILGPADLARSLAHADERRDAAGLYLVNEYFCGKDAWRATVQALMTRSEWVVMDLRGFAANNLGCIFELQALIDAVPAGRIVLFIDHTTDEALLRSTLSQCVERMAGASPNRGSDGQGTILVAGGRDLEAVDTLLEIVGRARA